MNESWRQWPCVEYPPPYDAHGYGKVRQPPTGPDRRWVGAHRAAFAAYYGPIPEGMWVLHHCDNPPCVEIHHLYLGTVADNARDRKQHGRPLGGRDSAAATLTDDDVRQIRKDLAAGAGVRATGRKYGVSHVHVINIRDGRKRRNTA